MRLLRPALVTLASLPLFACNVTDDARGGVDPSGTGADSETGATDEDGDGGDAGEVFDVATGQEGGGDEQTEGCQKIDFLFVIDNSGSMADEQEQLVASFPAFMAAIEDTSMVSDYQILVTDTDAASVKSKVYCGGAGCCESACSADPDAWCCELVNGECKGGSLCTPPADACDIELGAGRQADLEGDACEFVGGRRYIVEGEPDLDEAFECAALVGTDGDGNELVAESMLAAVGEHALPGACNDGFLRDDAILVVTLITDEGDASQGLADEWHDALVAAKGGDENAIVPLALVGDTDLDDAICEPFDEDFSMFGDGARPAPRFRDFASSFPHGAWGSVCADDFGPFFLGAIEHIDTACDEFLPPG